MSAALQAARRQVLDVSPQGLSADNPEDERAVQPLTSSVSAAAIQQEAHDLRLNHELSVQLAKEFNMRAAALKKAGEEIVELRRQVQLLRGENVQLKARLEEEDRLAEDARRRPMPEGLDRLSVPELVAKLQRAVDKYRDEKAKGAELGRRLEEVVKEAARSRGMNRNLSELERAHVEQNRELQRLQEDNRKMEAYRQTAHTQEKVIVKLEKTLEASLLDVQKAQRIQADVEKMKAENARIRERCKQLLAAQQEKAGGAGAEELQRKLLEKSEEVLRLEALVKDLQRSSASVAASPHLLRDRRELEEQVAKVTEWAHRCQAAEDRLQGVQQQLVESSKRHAAELSAMRVEVAKRDARVLELEVLARGRWAGADSAS